MEKKVKIIIFIVVVVIIGIVAFNNYRQAAFLSFSQFSSSSTTSVKSASQLSPYSAADSAAITDSAASAAAPNSPPKSTTQLLPADSQASAEIEASPDCANECNTLGERKCIDDKSYAVCIKDACLKLSEIKTCEGETTCENGICISNKNPDSVQISTINEPALKDSLDEEQRDYVCTDTDGGKNIYQRGEVLDELEHKNIDLCFNPDLESQNYGVCRGTPQEGCFLTEYSCEGNQMKKEKVSCPIGYECNTGACIRTGKTHNICVEKDGSYSCMPDKGEGTDACLTSSECQNKMKQTPSSLLSYIRNFFGL